MNILFVYSLQDIRPSTKPLWSADQMQFGISYISSFLKAHGHDTKLLVLSRKWGRKKIIDEYLKRYRPELICFTAVFSEYEFIAHIAKYIKRRYRDIYLLLGGCHASLNPEGILLGDFDALCVGEGEYPTLELASRLEKGLSLSGIPNLWIKNGMGIERNSTRAFLQELDSLPFPDREMWQEWINEGPGARIPVLLGRGCPFECAYCCNHAIKKISSGRYVRLRSIENIVDEIKDIAVKFPANEEIYLETESFSLDIKWAIKLCSALEHFNKTLDAPLSFGVNLRVTPNADFESLFAACRRSNFKYINIGLESGSERVRREILKRSYSNQDIINTVGLSRKYGLRPAFFNMIGIPGETPADFKETIKINRICLPDTHYNSIFFPYPGTELYSLCKDKGLLKKGLYVEKERYKAVLDLPGFTRKQIERGYVWFDYYVYKGNRPISKILEKVLNAKLSTNYYLRYFYEKISSIDFLRQLKHKLIAVLRK